MIHTPLHHKLFFEMKQVSYVGKPEIYTFFSLFAFEERTKKKLKNYF